MTTSLVVAIEPDRDQAARLSGIVRGRVGAQLVLAESVGAALAALGDRIPDLILTPALLSTRDDAALSARLRDFGPAAAHVQTVTVPRIGGAPAETTGGGILKRFRRARPAAAAADGCEPDVVAQQVAEYLRQAHAERASATAPAIEAPALQVELTPAPVAVVPPPIEVAPAPAEPLMFAAVEEPAPPPMIVEEIAASSLVHSLDAVTAPLPPIVDTAAIPEAIVEPIAAAPADVAPSPVESVFSVEDIDLQFWIADEPEPAAVEATVVHTPPVEDERFDIAAQDFADIDISSFLDGLVLPETKAPDAPEAPVPAAAAAPARVVPEPEPEPEPEPLPALPSRRKLPVRRHVPVPERVADPKATRRREKAPIQDEWGLFDPSQCGFAALIAKLDAVTDDDEKDKRRGTQTRVISYN